MFTKHLAIMIKSGVPISEALDTLAENTKSEYFSGVLRDILNDVQTGKSLYYSMKKYPKVFDTFYLNLIKISEEAGTLEENLAFLGQQISKDYALMKKIQGAMFYPSLVAFAGAGIGAFIGLYILPQLVDFFDALDVELPMTTQILLWVANLMKDHGIIIIFALIGFMVLIKFLLGTKAVKPLWHKIKLKIPIFGKLFQYEQLARFCRNFGMLLESGVPATLGLETTANTMNNIMFSKHLHEVEQALNKGKSISDAMKAGNYSEFPPMVDRMIQVGERTGNLEEVLIYMSEFYEEEIDGITKNLTTILEPIMLIIIGLGVGFIAMAIIGPIYSLTGSIAN